MGLGLKMLPKFQPRSACPRYQNNNELSKANSLKNLLWALDQDDSRQWDLGFAAATRPRALVL